MNMLYTLAQVFQNPGLPEVQADGNTVATVMQVVFGVFGAVSVLVVTIAGFMYIISQGDPQRIAKAKDTIIYAIIGLIVSMSGWAIVTFVIGRL